MRKVLAGIFLFTLAITASAANLVGNVIACTTKDSLGEAMRYLADDDDNGLHQLVMVGECIYILEGEQVSVVDRGFSVVQIRYNGLKVYTASGMVK